MHRGLLLEDAIARDIPRHTGILIGILPWGLGHATRCIPIIEALQHRQCIVKIYTGRESYQLLSERFPSADIVDGHLPPITLKGQSTVLHLLRNLPVLATYWYKSKNFIRKEQSAIKNQTIISDNLPGFYSGNARLNIYITHQIKLLKKDLSVSNLLTWFHYQFWKKYHLCWIPDDPAIRLAGAMSAPPTKKYRYIGLLSRFNPGKGSKADNKKILILLSGPEPQRTNLEQLLTECMGKLKLNGITLVRGAAENTRTGIKYPDHWRVFDLLQDAQIEDELRNAGTIITRCGYSTLMEIYQTNSRIICIPTPGQSEQQYLASNLALKGNNFLIFQENIEIELPSILAV